MHTKTTLLQTSQNLSIKHLGLCEYQKTHQAMLKHICQSHPPHEIWLLEHLPVYTQGRAGKEEHIRLRNHIPLIHTDRGGQVTYHGPGQLITYPLIGLKTWNLSPVGLVDMLESLIILTLKQLDLNATSDPNARGVYINQKKIASIGLKIKNGYAYHGVAINIDMDLSPFNAINPCGYKDLKLTSLNEHVSITMKDFTLKWTQNILEKLAPKEYTLEGI